jgi:hypothetical protein
MNVDIMVRRNVHADLPAPPSFSPLYGPRHFIPNVLHARPARHCTLSEIGDLTIDAGSPLSAKPGGTRTARYTAFGGKVCPVERPTVGPLSRSGARPEHGGHAVTVHKTRRPMCTSAIQALNPLDCTLK